MYPPLEDLKYSSPTKQEKCTGCIEKQKHIHELVEALRVYVLEYEIWAKAVKQVVGRIPETGVHLEFAKELIDKYKTPSE